MLAHSTPEQLQSDLRRQNDLGALGWTLLRFTYWDVASRPGYVAESLRLYFQRSIMPFTGHGGRIDTASRSGSARSADNQRILPIVDPG